MDEENGYGSGGSFPQTDQCGVCGGDGKLVNAWGQTAKCPSCHGGGRRQPDEGFRDVTKTKPSHHRKPGQSAVAEKQTWPSSVSGAALATDIKNGSLSDAMKEKLTREIIDHEATHGIPTKTFVKKMRKATGTQNK